MTPLRSVRTACRSVPISENKAARKPHEEGLCPKDVIAFGPFRLSPGQGSSENDGVPLTLAAALSNPPYSC